MSEVPAAAVGTTAPRTLVDEVAAAWTASRAAPWLGAGAVGLAQAVLTARTGVLRGEEAAMWCALASAVAVGALVARRWAPLTTAGVAALATTAAGVGGGVETAMVLPVLVAAYGLAARVTLPRAAAGVTGVAAALTVARLSSPGPFSVLARVVPTLLVLGMVVAVAAGFRARRTVLSHADRELAALAEERRAQGQRDHARRQARVVAELHDSVGHDLTAIITLSEGVGGTTGDPDLDGALAAINELARDGLADTRRAVASLAPSPPSPGAGPSVPLEPSTPLHDWDSLAGPVRTMRRTGTLVAVTETGHRPQEPAVAELVFTVVREALTNTMRHGEDVTRVTIALDHDAHTTRVCVADDGRPEPGEPSALASPPEDAGHGLAQLRTRLEAGGGRLTAGPVPGGWLLEAVVPHGTGAGMGGWTGAPGAPGAPDAIVQEVGR